MRSVAACLRALALSFLLAGCALTAGARAQEAAWYVAVGYGGRCVISRDGQTWEEQSPLGGADGRKADGALLDVAYGAGRFVAVGGGAQEGRILSSTDGRKWEGQSGVDRQVSTIVFGNGRFVACGEAGLMTSQDGLGFRTGRPFDAKGKMHARRSACGDTEAGFRFVILGEIVKPGESQPVSCRGVTGDGETWDHTDADAAPVNDIAYGAGNFVVVGANGLIESSHDGQTWVRRSSAPGEELRRVVWTGTRFFVSSLKTAWSSPDGFVWKREDDSTPCDVIWAREGQLGIGLSLIGELCTSRDLAHWKKAMLPDGPPWCAVARGAE